MSCFSEATYNQMGEALGPLKSTSLPQNVNQWQLYMILRILIKALSTN